jgi:hypothetical protein
MVSIKGSDGEVEGGESSRDRAVEDHTGPQGPVSGDVDWKRGSLASGK